MNTQSRDIDHAFLLSMLMVPSSQSLLEGFWYSHDPYNNSPRYSSLDSWFLWHQLSTKWRPVFFMPILLPLNSFLLWFGRVFLPVHHFRKQNAALDSFEVNTMHSSGIFRSTTWMTSICTNREMHTWFLLRVLFWFIHLYLTLSQKNYDIHNCWKRFHVTDWTSENFIYSGWHFLNSKIKKKMSSFIDIWVYHSANEFLSNKKKGV